MKHACGLCVLSGLWGVVRDLSRNSGAVVISHAHNPPRLWGYSTKVKDTPTHRSQASESIFSIRYERVKEVNGTSFS